MQGKNLRYVYGPVSSWRLGSSLGIDPISDKEKICSFNCIYCQLGETKNLTSESPDEIQINTPLRPCKAKPLPKKGIDKIKEYFKDLNCISVYDVEKREVKPISTKDTLKRRGKI